MDGRWYHDWGYFLLYLGGWFVFAALAWRLARRRDVPMRWVVLLLTTYAMGMGPVAHALYFLVVRNTLRNQPYVDAATGSVTDWAAPTLEHVTADVMALFESTGGLWGGPLAIVGTVVLALVLVREAPRVRGDVGDAVAVALPAALAMCKLGCLVNGCCHGIVGAGFPFVHFSWVGPNSPADGLDAFPTQALDGALYAVWAGILWQMHRTERARGRLLLWFVLLFSLGRLLSEFTRGDEEGAPLLGMTPVQVVLIVALPAVVLLLTRPRILERLLSWRGPEVLPDPDRRSHRAARRQAVFVLTALPVYFLLPMLLIPAPLLVLVHGIRVALRPTDLLRRTQLFGAIVLLSLGFLALAGFFMSVFHPLWVGGALLLWATLAAMGLPDLSSGGQTRR